MANERYPQDDYYNRQDPQDYGRDYGSGRSQTYTSARSYQASGAYDRDDDRHDGGGFGRDDHGRREYGSQRYGSRGLSGSGGYGGDRGYGDRYGRADRDFANERDSGYYQGGRSGGGYGGGDYGQSGGQPGGYGRGRDEYRGSYASDGQRFENVGRYQGSDDDDRQRQARGGYGRQPQGYRYEERGFLNRAGDEVRSWFGDEDAERRREQDARRDEYQAGERYGSENDSDYRNWRRGQIDALDRDYDEYRQQSRSKFESEFGTWRTGRQGQRDLLNKVDEHQEVVGSDGEHVGTVDKVRGDRVILTKSDKDAGGHHHSFPSGWLQSVDDKVTLSKTAAEAKAAWKDEERKGAMFAGDERSNDQGRSNEQARSNDRGQAGRQGGTDLNRSFSGTY